MEADVGTGVIVQVKVDEIVFYFMNMCTVACCLYEKSKCM
jgi:hypothetical protein